MKYLLMYFKKEDDVSDSILAKLYTLSVEKKICFFVYSWEIVCHTYKNAIILFLQFWHTCFYSANASDIIANINLCGIMYLIR